MKSIIKKLFRKKKIIYLTIAIVIVAVAGFFWLKNGNGGEVIVAKKGDFLRQVSVSGKVVVAEDINLSFEQSGQVEFVYIKEGEEVKRGQILARQDIRQLFAQLAETEANIKLQQAKLNQLMAGASAEDIAISENAVVSAQQDLDNAYDNALTNLDNALNVIYNADTNVLSLQNNYFASSDQQGIKVSIAKGTIVQKMQDLKLKVENAKKTNAIADIETADTEAVDGLNKVFDALTVIREQCDSGIYYSKVSSTEKSSLDTQKSNVNSALSKMKSSQQDIFDYKIALNQAENELAVTTAPAREEDIVVYKAQIKQAEASADTVLVQIEKRKIYSPIDGVISKINTKVGSVFPSNETALSVISSDSLMVESYVPEIYIPFVKIGDPAEIILDAYGQEIVFSASVTAIDPVETIRDGVSSYKIKLQFSKNDERIKPGMTANVMIITERKSDTIAIPQGAVFGKDGKKFVRVREGKITVEKEIKIGAVSSDGRTEILSGIKEGDEVIIK